MKVSKIDPEVLKQLCKPKNGVKKGQNGQVTIIGGSKLFHGAPLLSLKVASRIVDMVYFSSPEPSVGEVANKLKSKLMSFIWVPWVEVDKYIEKSDAVLIGPGMMRYSNEEGIKNKELVVRQKDKSGQETRSVTKKLLLNFPNKKWVIDAGSLQTMEASWIPENAVLTPNRKEFEMVFNKYLEDRGQSLVNEQLVSKLKQLAAKFKCTILLKAEDAIISDGKETVEVNIGKSGSTKGGTGDVLAGLIVALLAKNDPFHSACAASYIEKATADEIYKKVGTNFNADDLSDKIPEVLHDLMR